MINTAIPYSQPALLFDGSVSIAVRFITQRGFTSAGIRWDTDGLVSHVEFGTPQGTWIGAHLAGGVKERPADYCKPTLEYRYHIPCTVQQQAESLARMRAKIGTHYNLKDIFGLLLKARKLTNPHDLICSQFCTDELTETFGGYRVLNVLPRYSYLITPAILHLSPIFYGRRVYAQAA